MIEKAGEDLRGRIGGFGRWPLEEASRGLKS